MPVEQATGQSVPGLKELDFKVNEEWKKCAVEEGWRRFIPEFAEDSKGNKYMRRRGNSAVYKMIMEGEKKYSCVCTQCGSEVLSAIVRHSIWDGPGPCAGHGNVESENVPYCPKCESEPDRIGCPIEC